MCVKLVTPPIILSRLSALNKGTFKTFPSNDKFLKDKLQMEAELLPSSSPANAALSLDGLTLIWKEKLLRGKL